MKKNKVGNAKKMRPDTAVRRLRDMVEKNREKMSSRIRAAVFAGEAVVLAALLTLLGIQTLSHKEQTENTIQGEISVARRFWSRRRRNRLLFCRDVRKRRSLPGS